MLFFYSGDVPELDQLLLDALGPEHDLLIIPYSPHEMWAAKDSFDYFDEAGLRPRFLSRSEYLNPAKLRAAVMAADAVFLTGGNTYEFLAYARQVQLFELLTHFEAKGGIIASESAGSILLSPDVSTAGLPHTFADDNILQLTDLTAMGRVAYHFHPHHEPDSKLFDEEMAQLQQLADESKIPVLMLQDGQGLVMQGDGEIVHAIGAYEILLPQTAIEPVLLIDGQALIPDV